MAPRDGGPDPKVEERVGMHEAAAPAAELGAAQLRERVAELELKLRYRDAQLASEREISAKAKRKIRQLLRKISERDEILAELRSALEAVTAMNLAASDGSRMRRESSGEEASGSRRRSAEVERGGSGGLTSRDLLVKERADIVSQLEGHLTQMRANLADSDREVQELEARRQAKEADWKTHPDAMRTVESTQVHWQALSMITQQIQEKRRFAAELTSKTRELEEQVAQQRALIEVYMRGDAVGLGRPPRRDDDSGLSGAGSGDEDAARRTSTQRASPDTCEDESLRVFLSAAGAAAEAILSRPLLLASFEEQPPRLSAESIEGCSPEERVQVLSLFAAWIAVSGEAMALEDIGLTSAEVTELTGTLQTCGAQLEEWDMTRCPAEDATMRVLVQSLASQPLCRLNLGYNALGPKGAGALMEVAPSWSSSLGQLSLEMNGLGDVGCKEVATALEQGLLPHLRVLELGWNELSAACAPALALLLAGEAGRTTSDGSRKGRQLQRLGLAGNRLGCDGAAQLVEAALRWPSEALALDLSMNHVGAKPLQAVVDWASACDEGLKVGVSVNLEWNMVDDSDAVLRLAKAVGGKRLAMSDAPGAGRPLVLLANNESADIDAAAVAAHSAGLVVC